MAGIAESGFNLPDNIAKVGHKTGRTPGLACASRIPLRVNKRYTQDLWLHPFARSEGYIARMVRVRSQNPAVSRILHKNTPVKKGTGKN